MGTEGLADRGLVKGQGIARIAIDATTLEANAAMRSILRRDTGESHEELQRGLAKASGIETPTREELGRLDRRRKKRTSNKDWKSPADGDARITKMKDGVRTWRTKASTPSIWTRGAVVAVTLQGADPGDTTTLDEMLCEAGLAGREAELRPDDPAKVNLNGIEDLVTDKGYHSSAVVKRVKGYEVRSYIPEKIQKGRRYWQGKAKEQRAVYQNRRRAPEQLWQELTATARRVGGTQLCACYETGGMRRTHLRGQQNILKRQLIHVGAFNLSLILRKMLGAGTPRELRNRFGTRVLRLFLRLLPWDGNNWLGRSSISGHRSEYFVRSSTRTCRMSCRKSAASTTDC